jgi:outer membrane protein OmpA-like peptidoglycan-associated protein
MKISNIKKTVLAVIVISSVLLIFSTSIILIKVKQNNMVFRAPVLIMENPVVTYKIGKASYKNENSSEWNEIEIGIELDKGSIIQTGSDGEVDIRFSDKIVMRITGKSFLSINDISLKNISVNLNKGRLIAKFIKIFSKQEFSVITPTSIAGIRGTELIFDANDINTDIYGMSGITEIYNPLYPDDQVLLGFQTKTKVPDNQRPSNPESLTPEEVSSFRKLLDSLHTRKVLMINESIQFKAGTAEIEESSLVELDNLSKNMKWKFYKIEISGHTADVGDSGVQYTLSVKRAEKIKDYLISRKISKKRLLIKG